MKVKGTAMIDHNGSFQRSTRFFIVSPLCLIFKFRTVGALGKKSCALLEPPIITLVMMTWLTITDHCTATWSGPIQWSYIHTSVVSLGMYQSMGHVLYTDHWQSHMRNHRSMDIIYKRDQHEYVQIIMNGTMRVLQCLG